MYNLSSYGSKDIFVSKLDTDGNFIWAKNIGGSREDRGHGIVVDLYENIYITGFFEETIDVEIENSFQQFISQGEEDIFVSKLDNNGNVLWFNTMGGIEKDSGNAIVLDNRGDIYSLGSFRKTVDFNPDNNGIENITSKGSDDVFISKFDNSGSGIWTKTMGGVGSDRGDDLLVDHLGNINITGIFHATGDFDPSNEIFNLTSQRLSGAFVTKLKTI